VKDFVDHLCLAGDIDHDFGTCNNHTTIMNHRQAKFNSLVQQFSQELHEVSTMPSIRSEPIVQVMEVLGSPNSELTKQVNQLGYRAVRYGYQEGDVATKEGRKGLFQKVISCRPQHLWYSPTCGPWSSWSQLNESRSLESFQKIQQQRDDNLYQLALGLVLYRHQVSCGRHMHWEQPAKSIMLRIPLLREIIQGTQVAEFDMCRVGLMRDPVNQLLFKKGMEIVTTSLQFYQQFHGRKCNHQHDHQQLEGETVYKGMRIKRTELSERYNRKFARTIARVLTKVTCIKEVPMGVEFIAAASTKRSNGASMLPKPKRAKLRASELIEPQAMPAKRRRTTGKMSDSVNPSSICDRICFQVSSIAPRVGRKEILDSKILQDIQELFHDKVVVRAIVCKGTERTIMPPKDLMPDEAPYRRAIIVQRITKNILIEDQWEEWKYLSNRQLWRRSHPSFMNITVFARNPDVPEDSSAPSVIHQPEPARDVQSRTPDGSPNAMSGLEPTTAAPPDGATNSDMTLLPNPASVQASESPSKIDEQSQNHGSRFLAMSPENRKLAIRLHKNLGHPEPTKLSKVLQQRGYCPELCQGVLDLKCSVCQMQQRPKIQRPATLKEELEFGDKVSIDGVKWVNKQNQEFHFYHFIDHGTNYHTAVIAPNRADIQEKFIAGWLNWAGPPNTVLMDSASEFLSTAFQEYMQSLNVQCVVVPPDAHWQVGRIERHGGILQSMLSKYELEHDVTNYQQVQQALTHCTMAKNACSLRHGYSPETLVFGRGLRMPGSLTSDDSLPSHAIAASENPQGIRFRELLAQRETARKAFYSADNDMSLRRAALRRDRPHRGAYEPGEWVMIWKVHLKQGSWIGPARVIIQEGPTTVFCNNSGTLIRAAPEHVRPVSSVEAQLIPIEDQLQTMPQRANNEIQSRSISTTRDVTMPSGTNNEIIPNNSTSENHQRSDSHSSTEQPDQEPDDTNNLPQDNTQNNNNHHEQQELEPHEIPIPNDTDDELMCDLLTCEDVDGEDQWSPNGETSVWRAELEFTHDQLESMCQDSQNPINEDFLLLATATKKQRTEVKLSTLDPSERREFEEAKAKEVQNWLQTGTVVRMFRNELSPQQILRCRWLYVWKPITEVAEQKANNGKSRKAKARLVVLGFQDPQLDTIPRDSPTLGRTSKMLIAQVIASMGWNLMSFDIKAAFLQGRTQEGRVIAVEPVPEMVSAMNLEPNEACRLVKSAYGLIDAPFLWFTELDKTLRSLNFIPSPFDPCLYLLYKEEAQEPSGILGIHVDDGLCGGDSYFMHKIQELEKKFPFGSKKSQNFVFTGIEMTQNNDHSITMSQEKYVTKINPIHIQPNRKSQLELPVTERERQDLRALIGSLQYASVNTRPDLSSRLSFLQSDINKATIETLIQGNKVLHEAKRHKNTSIHIQPIPLEKIRFLAFSDASFASKKVPESHTGMMIMTTQEPCLPGKSNKLGL